MRTNQCVRGCLPPGNNEPMQVLPMPKEKVTSAIWSPLDEGIITGHENGDLCQWELKVGGIVLYHRTREWRLMSVGAEGWWNCTVSQDTRTETYVSGS